MVNYIYMVLPFQVANKTKRSQCNMDPVTEALQEESEAAPESQWDAEVKQDRALCSLGSLGAGRMT